MKCSMANRAYQNQNWVIEKWILRVDSGGEWRSDDPIRRRFPGIFGCAHNNSINTIDKNIINAILVFEYENISNLFSMLSIPKI